MFVFCSGPDDGPEESKGKPVQHVRRAVATIIISLYVCTSSVLVVVVASHTLLVLSSVPVVVIASHTHSAQVVVIASRTLSAPPSVLVVVVASVL